MPRYKYSQESGEDFRVLSPDKADAQEDTNEVRQILDDLGDLLGHSKRDDSYPKDETTGGKITKIAFPATQVPSADANTLDDYEEGSCTLGISFGAGTTGITYSANTGYYTKIGNIVNISGFIILTSKGTSTGDVLITGLPFTVGEYASVALYFSNITFANQFQGFTTNNATTIYLGEITEAGIATALTDADFADNSQIMLSCTYRCQ